VHASTTAALSGYARVRDRHWPQPKTPAFFVAQSGQRLDRSAVHYAFQRLIRKVGLEGQASAPGPAHMTFDTAMRC